MPLLLPTALGTHATEGRLAAVSLGIVACITDLIPPTAAVLDAAVLDAVVLDAAAILPPPATCLSEALLAECWTPAVLAACNTCFAALLLSSTGGWGSALLPLPTAPELTALELAIAVLPNLEQHAPVLLLGLRLLPQL